MPNEVEQKLMGWLSFERIVTVASVLVAVGGLITVVQNHGQRIGKLEEKDEARNAAIMEMRGDIKVLLERTERK